MQAVGIALLTRKISLEFVEDVIGGLVGLSEILEDLLFGPSCVLLDDFRKHPPFHVRHLRGLARH